MILLPLFLSSTLWAQNFSISHPPIASLCRLFYQAVDKGEKEKILRQIAQTPPASDVDVQYDFDLYMRYPQPGPRTAVMSSLSLLKAPNPDLAPAFIDYLSLKDPQAMIFAIQGAYQIRSKRAFPIIEKIAKSSFKFASPDQTLLPKDKGWWWAHYSALDALALWKGEGAFSLILKKSFEAPSVARILASHFWPKTLPLIIKWSKGSLTKREMSREAASADIPLSELKKAYAPMLVILENNKISNDLRHDIAIKVGISASEEQIKALIKEYQSLSDKDERVMVETALFASRSRQVVPILMHYVKTNPDPIGRANARLEIKDLVGPAEYRDLLDWVVHNDPDAQNRKEATQELNELGGD
jgi:hypothetical protein